MNNILSMAAIAACLAAGPAHAVCSEADIGGTWAFYGDVFSGAQGSALALHCTLHIDATSGKMATGSTCQSTASNGSSSHGTVTFGNVLITEANNCTYYVRFGTDTGRHLSVEARHATLSQSKEIIAGMIANRPGGLQGAGSVFTMVKIH